MDEILSATTVIYRYTNRHTGVIYYTAHFVLNRKIYDNIIWKTTYIMQWPQTVRISSR